MDQGRLWGAPGDACVGPCRLTQRRPPPLEASRDTTCRGSSSSRSGRPSATKWRATGRVDVSRARRAHGDRAQRNEEVRPLRTPGRTHRPGRARGTMALGGWASGTRRGFELGSPEGKAGGRARAPSHQPCRPDVPLGIGRRPRRPLGPSPRTRQPWTPNPGPPNVPPPSDPARGDPRDPYFARRTSTRSMCPRTGLLASRRPKRRRSARNPARPSTPCTPAIRYLGTSRAAPVLTWRLEWARRNGGSFGSAVVRG